MSLTPRIHCWQPTIADHAALTQAQRLYERTIEADERIPWIWIERSIIDREPSPGGWRKHLLLASHEGELAGYVYGAFLPGFGGYLCYVSVDERFRKLGVATVLYDAFYAAMRADANTVGESLPFVLWESYRPSPDEGEMSRKLWLARTRLFDRVGGRWLEGIELQTPNFSDDDASAVPLQVFLRPMDEPAEALDAVRLRQVIGELLDRVYDEQPGSMFYDATLPAGCEPRLVSATQSRPVLEAA